MVADEADLGLAGRVGETLYTFLLAAADQFNARLLITGTITFDEFKTLVRFSRDRHLFERVIRQGTAACRPALAVGAADFYARQRLTHLHAELTRRDEALAAFERFSDDIIDNCADLAELRPTKSFITATESNFNQGRFEAPFEACRLRQQSCHNQHFECSLENFNSGMFFSSLRRSQICFIVASLAFGLPVQAAYARLRVFEIVVDASTGTVLFSEAPDAARRLASLTKLMTLYLAFEAHADGRLQQNDPLPISRRVARQPAMHLGIASGGRITVGKALDAIAAISSSNLAVAVAERIAGSEPKFARLMTAKARQLGMRNTRFANARGLTSADNITTASDMPKLSRAIVRRFPQQYARFSKRTIQWRSRRTANHNHLLGRVTGVNGIKTEYTSDAGYKFTASAMRRGRRIVVVVLGETSV